MHSSANDVIDMLAKELLPVHQRSFRNDVKYAVSVALAKGRAQATLGAIAKIRAAAAF